MKKYILFTLLALCLSGVVIIVISISNDQVKEDQKAPNEWFFLQRSFPYPEINYQARDEAFRQASRMKTDKVERGEGWVDEGPYNIGGRISAVAMHPSDLQTIYAGAASGGIFKSTDGGGSWTPVFDDALSLSIGDIAVAPSDPGIVWVGTGEANAGGGSMTYDGFGIYRSTDAGTTWMQVGLENSGSVGRLAVHPNDPLTCYVAAMGRLFSDNPERGIFKTSNGGFSWENVLYINDSVGGIDIVIHPDHPDTLYAAMWERVRRPGYRNYGGTGCGIYRSYDGGDSWVQLSGGLPVNSSQNGRIGIDISESDPDILYAIYADDIGYFAGVYKSTNGGDTWARTNDDYLADMYSSYGWWFGRISIDPVNPDIVYPIGFDLYKSTNGGSSWSMISSYVHVDQHDMVIHPLNHNYLVLGNDAGIYISDNGGSTWEFKNTLPITQFYTCEIDEQYPQLLYGGTQDNGTNRTMTGGMVDWESIYWGDGFHVLVDPSNNNYVYAEYQYGNFARSTNGGSSFSTAMSGISSGDRKNWNTPFVFDPTNPQVLYYGANRLYKTTNRAVSWQVISPDLTNGGGSPSVVYGTITTIAVAASNPQFIYAGTDDGNVWKTTDGGSNWDNISAGLPLRWITRVAVDPFDELKIFVTLSGYRYDSFLPHVFYSSDAGETWSDISGNLPDAPVNDIIPDPELDETLYLATDFGVFVTRDHGQNWSMLGNNLPNVPIVDLDFHQPTRTLVAATYGRSMFSFDVDQTVTINETLSEEDRIILYPNPVSNTLFVNLDLSADIDYSIIDLSGNIVAKSKLNHGNSTHSIDVTNLKPGTYIIKFKIENKILKSKFLKS